MEKLRYCPKCGREIDSDSAFCTHCGFTLKSSVGNNLWSKLKNSQRIGIVITGLWLLIHFCLYVINAYGPEEFIFCEFLIPTLLWGVIYIYTKNKKVGFAISIGLVALILVPWLMDQYDEYKKEHIITTEFLSCTLGEDYSSVVKKIKKEYMQCIENTLSDETSLVLSNVSYGSRRYDRMRFDFYKGKLYQVYFRKTYETEKDKLNAYKDFQEILEQKNYPHDSEKYNKYSNTYYYSDKNTELHLRHSVYEYDGSSQFVQLFYYDLNSHQKDEGL